MLLLSVMLIFLVSIAKSDDKEGNGLVRPTYDIDGPLLVDMKTRYYPPESDPRTMYWFDDIIRYETKLLQDQSLKPLKRRPRSPVQHSIEHNSLKAEQPRRTDFKMESIDADDKLIL